MFFVVVVVVFDTSFAMRPRSLMSEIFLPMISSLQFPPQILPQIQATVLGGPLKKC